MDMAISLMDVWVNVNRVGGRLQLFGCSGLVQAFALGLLRDAPLHGFPLSWE